MVRVKLMATILFRHSFDKVYMRSDFSLNKSKLVHAGKIQQSNCRMKIATKFSKQGG